MNDKHIEIHRVIGTSWADDSKFERGDLVQAINGQKAHSRSEVFLQLEQAVKHGVAEITVLRANNLITVKLIL